MKKYLRIAASVFVAALLAGSMTACRDNQQYRVDTPAPAADGTADPAAPADAVTSGSPKESADPQALLNGMSANGFWIFSLIGDVTLDQPLLIEGEFHERDSADAKIFRKLALNTQDAQYQVIDRFTLTVPEVVVSSPSLLVQHGTIDGKVSVKADGLQLVGVTITGDLAFDTQAQYDSAVIDDASSVQGAITVAGAAPVAAAEPTPSPTPAPTPTPEASPSPSPEASPEASAEPAEEEPEATPEPAAEDEAPAPAEPAPEPAPEPAAPAGIYKPGTYTGSGTGGDNAATVSVSVTVDANAITAITVTSFSNSYGEDRTGEAQSAANAIVQTQSTADIVSSASAGENEAVSKAVNAALAQAAN